MLQVILRLAPSLLFLAVAVRVRRIQRAFIDAGTTGPERATTLAALNVRGSGIAFTLLVRRGVLVRSGGGYFLDMAAMERWQRRRRTILPIVLASLGALLLWLLIVER